MEPSIESPEEFDNFIDSYFNCSGIHRYIVLRRNRYIGPAEKEAVRKKKYTLRLYLPHTWTKFFAVRRNVWSHVEKVLEQIKDTKSFRGIKNVEKTIQFLEEGFPLDFEKIKRTWVVWEASEESEHMRRVTPEVFYTSG